MVEDDPQVLELFESILKQEYHVEVADAGDTGLDVIDDRVDDCLIGRRMPGMAGEEAFERLREAGFDQPVAMVTAIEPDFDIIEIGFDDYVVKPVSPIELRDLVKSLVLRREYDDTRREYFALASKITALTSSKSPEELAANDGYRQTVDKLNEIKLEAKHSLDAATDAGVLEELLLESFLDGQAAGV